ncbi:MAG: hypothetical protein MZV70_36330 [Desulfobacterales bacterium]|nr:hypothetical protein [Desulfobacterales bacterium]
MRKRIDRYREYLVTSKAHEIARRLFVMNAFDGALTIMGVVIGALPFPASQILISSSLPDLPEPWPWAYPA